MKRLLVVASVVISLSLSGCGGLGFAALFGNALGAGLGAIGALFGLSGGGGGGSSSGFSAGAGSGFAPPGGGTGSPGGGGTGGATFDGVPGVGGTGGTSGGGTGGTSGGGGAGGPGDDGFTDTIHNPEPATMIMVGSGLLAGAYMRRRKQRKA